MMGVYVKDNKLAIITELRTLDFDLPKDVNNSLNEIDSIIKQNEFLVEHSTKNKISQLLSKYQRGNDIY